MLSSNSVFEDSLQFIVSAKRETVKRTVGKAGMRRFLQTYAHTDLQLRSIADVLLNSRFQRTYRSFRRYVTAN